MSAGGSADSTDLRHARLRTQLNRDRFVLSNGHACALQYIMLHLTGYDIPMEQLQRFRKLDSM